MAIKNILFDLDDTLIVSSGQEIWYKEVLSNLGYNPNDYKDVYDAIGEYELSVTEENCFYDKNEILDFINNTLNRNYSISLIDEINKIVGEYWITQSLVQESTLKYLNSKYDLYIFTNWFKGPQWRRLEKLGFSKYFKDIFSSEQYGAKPHKIAYLNVLKALNCNANECCMIGDSKLCDIVGSKNVGMEAILFDYDGNRDKKDVIAHNYSVVTDLKDLEKIL